MPLSPRLYHWFVRPKWFTDRYIHRHIRDHVDLEHKMVLDFGSGTGANCCICSPGRYVGIEPDAGRVALASRLYPSHRFAVFDGNRIPADNGSIDLVLIVAVLHHIPDRQIADYLQEFRRVLKSGGQLVVLEPCLLERSLVKNRFMNWYDDGEYIRNEDSYLKLFSDGQYDCQVLKKFPKCFVYHELFFSATPR